MKHRHPGRYVTHTPKGRILTKHKPIHDLTIKVPKRIMDKDKGKSWNQLKHKYPHLNPLADVDGDGKRNYEDCRPFDKKKQDVFLGEPDYNTFRYDDKKKLIKSDSSGNDDFRKYSHAHMIIGDKNEGVYLDTPHESINDEDELIGKVSDTLLHETMHHELSKTKGIKTAMKWDNLTNAQQFIPKWARNPHSSIEPMTPKKIKEEIKKAYDKKYEETEAEGWLSAKEQTLANFDDFLKKSNEHAESINNLAKDEISKELYKQIQEHDNPHIKIDLKAEEDD